MLKGKKTLLTGVAMIAYAVLGIVLGTLDQATAVSIGGTGAGIVFLRMAVK